MKFKKMPASPDFVKIQNEMLDFWDIDRTFEKSVKNPGGKSGEGIEQMVFIDGPPFPTGIPHHGTVVTSFIKDMIARFWTMKGFSIPRQWGWDCHGLPIETDAEKILGITDKRQIEGEVGIAKFNDTCKNIVSQNNDSWANYVRKMCRWVDYKNNYKTMDDSFMDSVMWAFKTCYDKGYIYQDHRSTPYCYRCETPLSISDTRESDSTRPRQDTWALARFKVRKEQSVSETTGLALHKLLNSLSGKQVYLLAWTTTPWTLPSNMALAVNPEIDYVFVEVDDVVYITGKESLGKYEKVWGKEPQLLKMADGKDTIKGAELKGLKYEPITPYFSSLASSEPNQGAFRVIVADFVTVGDGVGIVHIAPGFGEDDYWVARNNNVPFVCPVNEKGQYTFEITDFVGQNVMDANIKVLRMLREKGAVILDGSIMHNYPHCWRCKTPLLHKAMEAWYFSIEKVKDKLLAANKEINWVPGHANEGRFTPWVSNARDWNISRNRYWATPLPVWKCTSDDGECTHVRVFGGRAEIEKASGVKVKGLHRQYLDDIVIKCDCGKNMRRISEVMDCWFEAGSVPFASKNYPFSGVQYNPSDFIVEYAGQIRCWFYVLHVLGVALFDKPAFKNVVVHGTILASDGKKLSKSSKNYTDPMELMDTFGTDAYRLYLYRSNAMIIGDLLFDQQGIKEQIQKILLPLYNCVNFFLSYAELDGYVASKEKYINSDNSLDQWILGKLYECEKHISKNMAGYQIDEYVEPIVDLIDGLSTWYLRRSRRRFWESGVSLDKQNAYDITCYVLVSICKMLGPVAPVLSDYLYQILTNSTMSVHLERWPSVPEQYKNEEVLMQTDVVMRVITLARRLRERENVKLRQPLSRLDIAVAKERDRNILTKFKDIVSEEINVKEIKLLDDVAQIATVEYLPNFATLKKFGSRLREISLLVKSGKFSSNAIASGGILSTNECYLIEIDGEKIYLNHEDILVKYTAKEGLVESDHDIVVRLDTRLDDELKEEGMAREIIRNVQDARKQLGCEINDKIKIELTGDIPQNFIDYICEEVLGVIAKIDKADATCDVLSNGKVVMVKIRR
ncbi:MAG: isoleucine--tRNA ligase [Firmicutes bacterium]|nr:isoleucine--tRNA ligase [Bacillota bacterium]